MAEQVFYNGGLPLKNENERREVPLITPKRIVSSTMIQPEANVSSLFGEVSNLSSSGVPTISSGTMRQLGPIIEAVLAEDDCRNNSPEAKNNGGCNNQPFALKTTSSAVEVAAMNMFDCNPLHAPVALANEYRTIANVYESDESADESTDNENESTVIEALRRLNLKDGETDPIRRDSLMPAVNHPFIVPSTSHFRFHPPNKQAAMANYDRALAPLSGNDDSPSEITPPVIKMATPTSNAPRKKTREECASNVNHALRCLNLSANTEPHPIDDGLSLALVKYIRPSTDQSEMVRYNRTPAQMPNQYEAISSAEMEQSAHCSSLALVRYRRPSVDTSSASVVRYHRPNTPVNNYRPIEYKLTDTNQFELQPNCKEVVSVPRNIATQSSADDLQNVADMGLYENITSPDTFESDE